MRLHTRTGSIIRPEKRTEEHPAHQEHAAARNITCPHHLTLHPAHHRAHQWTRPGLRRLARWHGASRRVSSFSHPFIHQSTDLLYSSTLQSQHNHHFCLARSDRMGVLCAPSVRLPLRAPGVQAPGLDSCSSPVHELQDVSLIQFSRSQYRG